VTGRPATPGIGRRLLSLVYEALLLIAVVLLAGGIAAALTQIVGTASARFLTQIIVAAACPSYFVWQWHRGGQTLPMKTWRLKLAAYDGAPLTPRRGIYRFVIALLGLMLFGAGFLWALIDRDRQFLHDRLAGTKIINDERGTMNAERL